MATVEIAISPREGIPAATNGAQFDVIAGTNFPVPVLWYDATTSETAYFYFRPQKYGSGNITAKVGWYADTASSGDVTWDLSLAAITPNTDSQDIETKAFATANSATDTHLGTTGQRLHEVDVTLSNLDSIAAGDWACLRVVRNVSDTMTGDAGLVGILLTYSDT